MDGSRSRRYKLFLLFLLQISLMDSCVGSPADNLADKAEDQQHNVQNKKSLKDLVDTGVIEEADDEDKSVVNAKTTSPSTPLLRQYFNPSIIDGKQCNRKSEAVISHISQVHKVKKKQFYGCTLTNGEQAMITNQMDTAINIGCMRQKGPKEQELEAEESKLSGKKVDFSPENIEYFRQAADLTANINPNTIELLSTRHLRKDYVFVMNVYVDPENDHNKVGPNWMCVIDRVNRGEYGSHDHIFLRVFSNYTKKESFRYEVTTNGVYEANPRLVESWTALSSRLLKGVGQDKVNITNLFPRSPGADFLEH
jgi:hypothetical protein